MCAQHASPRRASVATLRREHDAAIVLTNAALAAMAAYDMRDLQRACRALSRVLAPHSAVEERALFPALATGQPGNAAAVREQHAHIRQVIDAVGDGEVGPEAQSALVWALDLLGTHILEEESSVFPGALATLTATEWDEVDRVRTKVGTGLTLQLPMETS